MWSLYFAAQVAIVAVSTALIAERAKTLFFVLPAADAILRPKIRRGQGRGLAIELPETLLGRVFNALEISSDDPGVRLAEEIATLRDLVSHRLSTLRVLGFALSTTGLLGAALAYEWGVHGDHGLLALDPTLVRGEAIMLGASAIALGFGGSWMILAALSSFKRQARLLLRSLDFYAEHILSERTWTESNEQ